MSVMPEILLETKIHHAARNSYMWGMRHAVVMRFDDSGAMSAFVDTFSECWPNRYYHLFPPFNVKFNDGPCWAFGLADSDDNHVVTGLGNATLRRCMAACRLDEQVNVNVRVQWNTRRTALINTTHYILCARSKEEFDEMMCIYKLSSGKYQ